MWVLQKNALARTIMREKVGRERRTVKIQLMISSQWHDLPLSIARHRAADRCLHSDRGNIISRPERQAELIAEPIFSRDAKLYAASRATAELRAVAIVRAGEAFDGVVINAVSAREAEPEGEVGWLGGSPRYQ